MWSNKYVDIPYQEKGRDHSGVDCWGLVRLVYDEQFNVKLPSFSSEYHENDTLRIQELFAQYKEGWEVVTEPSEGIVVLFRVRGTESHIGIAVSPTQFLHAREGYSSAIENFSSIQWKNRILGYYKYNSNSKNYMTAVPHPLRTERFIVPVLPGSTVRELVEHVKLQNNIQPELKSTAVIMLNTRVIPESEWNTTLINSGDTIEYRAIPLGSDTFRMIAFIAIAIYAPYLANFALGGSLSVSALAAAGTVGLATGVSAFTLAATTVAVSLVGSLLINAIAPIRPPASPNDPGSAQAQLMITSAGNQANTYGAIPVILGKVRLTPPLGAQNFITYENERDTYLTMLLVWGFGPLNIDYTTLKIGEVALSGFTLSQFSSPVTLDDNTTTSTKFITLDRKTTPSTNLLNVFNSIYGNDVYQVTKNLILACDGNPEGSSVTTYSVDDSEQANPITTTTFATPGPWSTAASNAVANKAIVAIHWPQGLRKVKTKGNGAGDSSATEVTLAYQVKVGTADWVDWKRVTYGKDAAKKDAFTVTETYDSTTPQLLQVRVRRETGAHTEDNPDWRYFFDAQHLSTTFVSTNSPAVDPRNCTIAKTALQIKANDQLTNSIEGINAIVQTYCLSWNGSGWVMAATNNPADLFRYVIQHPANPQRVLDADVSTKIDLVKLQYWHDYCATKGFTFNKVQGDTQSVLNTLKDICAAGRASPALIDGKWSVVIDEPKSTIVQHFSPHNSWGFEGTHALPRLPHGLRINYYDEDQNYQQTEIIVYAPGYSQANAELFESIQLPGVTNASQVEDHARWHMAQAQLRRESYILNADIEYIVANRGDRVKVAHDVPMWGLGSGRVKNRITDSIFELDEDLIISASNTYTIRFRSSTGASNERTIKTQFTITNVSRANNITTVTLNSQHPLNIGDTVIVAANLTAVNTTKALITAVTTSGFSYAQTGTSISNTATSGTVTLGDGYYHKVQITTAINISDANSGDLFLFGKYQQESQDLIITSIEPTTNKSARISLVDYGVTDTYNIFIDYKTLTANTIFKTNITIPNQLNINAFADTDIPAITSLKSDDSVAEIISPGTYAYRIRVSFANSTGLPVGTQNVECQYDLSSSFNGSNYKVITVPLTSNTITIPNVIKGETYKLRLRYVSSDGRTGNWTAWSTHTVNGKQFNYGNVDTVIIKRVGRYINVIPSMAVLPDDFKFYEVRVFKDTGTGDFWDSTDTTIIKTKTTSIANIDLKQFPAHRISAAGVKYRIAIRTVNTVGNYSTTSLLGDITLYTITP